MLKKLRDLSILYKIQLNTGVTLFIVAVFAIAGVMMVGKITTQTSGKLNDMLSFIDIQNELVFNKSELEEHFRKVLALGQVMNDDNQNKKLFEKEVFRFKEHAGKVDKLLKNSFFRTLQSSKGELSPAIEKEAANIDFYLRNVMRNHSSNIFSAERVFNLLYHGKIDQAKTEADLIRKRQSLDHKQHSALDQLTKSIQLYVKESTAFLSRKQERLISRLTVQLVIAIMVSLVVGSIVSQSIKHNISLAKSATEQIAAGKRDLHIVDYSNDEVGQLLETIEQMSFAIKESEEKLKTNQAQLVQSDKMASIGQLAAGVAHEINNPVGFIASNIGTLSEYMEVFNNLLEMYAEVEAAIDKKQDKRLEKILGRIREVKGDEDYDFISEDVVNLIKESSDGAKRVKDIVQNLKMFARADENTMQDSDLNEGVESTLKILENELKYKCEVKKELGVLPLINCNLGKINQVFVNILVNAAHAIDDFGQILIKTEASKDYVEVTIADSGHGIPVDKLKHIFDPFYTTKPVGIGTGLGLAISHGIITEHGGTIDAESVFGEGTSFRIRLPIEEGRDCGGVKNFC